MKTILLSVIFVMIVIGCGSVYAEQTSFFDKCSTSQNHHCMSYLPQQSRNITGIPQNWSFDLFMPDGTCNIKGVISSNGLCTYSSIILSDKNFTALKNNPFIGSVQNIFSTSSGPVKNYCPVALFTLTHQDGYFYKVQNITNLVYPDYCIPETGPNPYPVPEFGDVAFLVTVIAMFSAVIISMKRWNLK